MNEIFRECGVRDTSNESIKWKRIYYTFLVRQEIDGSSNAFLNFIKKSLKPVRFINGQNGDYDEILLEINKPLMLIGLQMTNEKADKDRGSNHNIGGRKTDKRFGKRAAKEFVREGKRKDRDEG